MSEYLSDAEEKEKIIEWWKENGRFILAGVGLGLVGIFSWRGWLSHLDTQASAASSVYEEMLTAVNEEETEKAAEKLALLSNDYKSTAYAAQAYLLMAKTSVEANKLDDAVSQIEQAIAITKDRELAELAQFRLAKLHLAKKDYAKALSDLEQVESKSYLPLVEELRGDVYRAQGDLAKARSAYETAQTAMQETPIGDPNLLQMKLSDLGAAN